MQEFMGALCVKDKSKEKFMMLNIANDGFFLMNENGKTVLFSKEQLYDLLSFGFSKGMQLDKPPVSTHTCAYSGITFPSCK